MAMHFEKADNRNKLHVLKSNDGKNKDIFVNHDEWMRPKDIISEGSEMPNEVLGLLRKWSKEINKIRTDFECRAMIGYAHVDFVYESSVYKLQPGAIAATKDMFHHISDMIQKDLRLLGCPYIHYHWEMD